MTATAPTAPVLADLIDPLVVASIAEEVWTALYDEECFLAPPQPLPADALSAWVRVTGPWCGAVVVSCAASTAEALTVRMHRARPLPEVEAEDVEDALGELANVLGGNVKALLPGPSVLGLPQVATTPPVGSSTDTCRIDVLWRDAALTLTVQGDPAPVTTPTTEKDEVPL
jgi:chemotaxis protein CheX